METLNKEYKKLYWSSGMKQEQKTHTQKRRKQTGTQQCYSVFFKKVNYVKKYFLR